MKTFLTIILLTFLTFSFSEYSLAEKVFVFDCQDSSITGSIKYSVIGQYRAKFKECSGTVTYDESKKEIKSVNLEIQSKSIHSDCHWCDDIVKSKQLLDIQKYPLMTYKSDILEKKNDGYAASGHLTLHGVTRKLDSNFMMEEEKDGVLKAKGKWVFRRKDFGITWNKLLDHGGILVGDHVTVDWNIQAAIKGDNQ